MEGRQALAKGETRKVGGEGKGRSPLQRIPELYCIRYITVSSRRTVSATTKQISDHARRPTVGNAATPRHRGHQQAKLPDWTTVRGRRVACLAACPWPHGVRPHRGLFRCTSSAAANERRVVPGRQALRFLTLSPRLLVAFFDLMLITRQPRAQQPGNASSPTPQPKEQCRCHRPNTGPTRPSRPSRVRPRRPRPRERFKIIKCK